VNAQTESIQISAEEFVGVNGFDDFAARAHSQRFVFEAFSIYTAVQIAQRKIVGSGGGGAPPPGGGGGPSGSYTVTFSPAIDFSACGSVGTITSVNVTPDAGSGVFSTMLPSSSNPQALVQGSRSTVAGVMLNGSISCMVAQTNSVSFTTQGTDPNLSGTYNIMDSQGQVVGSGTVTAVLNP
jgi:hypothetical protein